ncbi:hypothetical protein BDN71DRAFT_738587 [Pleurotus eryngii]|uniref:Uncharacterized protein n=1 Tax=Pleurotus eryngii TaxID=5323 RepID=A0A9P6D151_PLEER|nr:hypothetical protein BDN71DRAFT_738587 [Pleurotus eryngii]
MRRRWGPGGDGSGKEGRKEWGVEKAERGVYIPTRRILLLTYRHSTIQKVCPATSRGRVAVAVDARRVYTLPSISLMKYSPGRGESLLSLQGGLDIFQGGLPVC